MIKLNDRESIRSQIADFYREKIRSGEMKDGDGIPSARSLARELGTAEANVHHALFSLAKEGLIVRRPKRGSIVLSQPKLKHVAFYMNSIHCMRGERFTRPLIECLERELSKYGIDCTVIYDTDRGIGRKELKRLAGMHRIQGVLVRSLESEDLPFFNSLSVPFAAISSMRIPNGTGFFGRELAEKAVAALDAHGCRELGIIYPGVGEKLLEQVSKEARKRKIRVLEDNFVRGNFLSSASKILDLESFAYYATNFLWKKPNRPDGILVFSDDLISGITMSLYQNGIQVPRDMVFAIHRTIENPVVFPFPAVLVENSIAELSEHLVAQLRSLADGEKSKRKILSVSVRDYTPDEI